MRLINHGPGAVRVLRSLGDGRVAPVDDLPHSLLETGRAWTPRPGDPRPVVLASAFGATMLEIDMEPPRDYMDEVEQELASPPTKAA